MKVPVALGAVGALEKPFKQVDLLAKVDRFLGRRAAPHHDAGLEARVLEEGRAAALARPPPFTGENQLQGRNRQRIEQALGVQSHGRQRSINTHLQELWWADLLQAL
jgi:hypothetical protein